MMRTTVSDCADPVNWQTYENLVIVDLADEVAAQGERIASLEADIIAYRELAQHALTALHDVTRERNRLSQQHQRLVDEYRALRRQRGTRQAAA